MSSKGLPYALVVHQALDFAAFTHRAQVRKDEDIPYISHLAMVGQILERAGFDEEVVAAGVLHDTMEDQNVPRNLLSQRFGERIAALVEHVSERDKTLPWDERKKKYLEHLEEAPVEALAISCADKIQNFWSMLVSRRNGKDVWKFLKRGREIQISRFERLSDLFRRRLGHSPLQQAFEEAFLQVKKEC